MLPTIALIVPTYNEEKHINKLIQSLRYQNLNEIIVVDGGSTDDTVSIISKYPSIKLLHSNKGRAKQMNTGAYASKSEVLLFLHADTLLPKNGTTMIRSAISNGVHGGSFYLSFDHDHFMLKTYSLLSRFNYSLLTYGDQGIFIKAKAFERIGGYADVNLLEDLILVKQIKKIGHFEKLKSPVTTSSRRFLKHGIIRQQLKNIVIVSLFLLGISPDRLLKWYQ